MINYNLVTPMEAIQTVIVAIAFYVACEMIYKRYENKKNSSNFRDRR